MAHSTIFLDWGGTLAQVPNEFAQPWKIWAQVLENQGHKYADERIQSAIDAADRQVGHQIYAYLGRSSEFWKMYDERVMDALGIQSHREKLEESIRYVFEDPSVVRLYPETPVVLASLREQGYRTGLISNHHDGLRRILKHYRLEPWLDTITYSQEAGAEKPNPEVFRLALRRAGCMAADAVHVGDSIEADVEGARRAGIAPIWLNRRRIDRSPACPVIQSLDELIPLLDAWV